MLLRNWFLVNHLAQAITIVTTFLTVNLHPIDSVSYRLSQVPAFLIIMTFTLSIENLCFLVYAVYQFARSQTQLILFVFAVSTSTLGWTIVVSFNNPTVTLYHTSGVGLFMAGYLGMVSLLYLNKAPLSLVYLLSVASTVAAALAYIFFYFQDSYNIAYPIEWVALFSYSLSATVFLLEADFEAVTDAYELSYDKA